MVTLDTITTFQDDEVSRHSPELLCWLGKPMLARVVLDIESPWSSRTVSLVSCAVRRRENGKVGWRVSPRVRTNGERTTHA